MKGQKLYVRPLEPGDDLPVESPGTVAGRASATGHSGPSGLVGRLAGTTVAYLVWHRDGDALVIDDFVVTAELRGLRIGRSLLIEAVTFAASQGAATLEVARDCKLARYFERAGFVSAKGPLIRTIR